MLFLSACKNESVLKTEGESNTYDFYIGTYTQKEGHVDGKGEGVYRISINMDNDSMKLVHTIRDFVNPSFLALSQNGKHIYVVNELGPNPDNYNARLSHISIDSTGRFRKAQESGTFGQAACHVALNPKGNMVVVSNYMGGELAFGQIGENGNLKGEIKHLTFTGKSVNAARQEASHLHMAAFTKDGSRVIAVDLGTDSLRVFSVDEAKGELTQINATATKPGDGPRHFALSSDEKILYVINELSNSVSSYTFDQTSGALSFIASASTLPINYSEANSTAEILVSADGKHLYASNRGHNSIAHFTLDGKGALTLLDHTSTEGKSPRNFTITHDGKYMVVANQDTDNVVVFEIQADGKLKKKAVHTVKTPVCVVEIGK